MHASVFRLPTDWEGMRGKRGIPGTLKTHGTPIQVPVKRSRSRFRVVEYLGLHYETLAGLH
jgi:hypothetical protein